MPTKECTECHEQKELDQFHKHPSGMYGRHPKCKACRKKENGSRYQSNRTEILAQQKDYIARQKTADPEGYRQRRNEIAARHRANPENTIKLRYLDERYGLTPEQYQAMEQAQEGLCKICRNPPNGRWPRLHVDHDHKTGAVRGLLCFRCNAMLGHAQDDVSVLQAAVAYLQR